MFTEVEVFYGLKRSEVFKNRKDYQSYLERLRLNELPKSNILYIKMVNKQCFIFDELRMTRDIDIALGVGIKKLDKNK